MGNLSLQKQGSTLLSDLNNRLDFFPILASVNGTKVAYDSDSDSDVEMEMEISVQVWYRSFPVLLHFFFNISNSHKGPSTFWFGLHHTINDRLSTATRISTLSNKHSPKILE